MLVEAPRILSVSSVIVGEGVEDTTLASRAELTAGGKQVDATIAGAKSDITGTRNLEYRA